MDRLLLPEKKDAVFKGRDLPFTGARDSHQEMAQPDWVYFHWSPDGRV